MVRCALCGLLTTPTVSGSHERALVLLLLFLLFGGTVGGAFASVLIPPRLAIKAIEDRSDHFFAQGVAGGDVKEFLGGSQTLASHLVNQILIGGPGYERPYNISVGDVRQLVALTGEASDVPMEGFFGLLLVVLEVPWVSRVLVCALEVSHEDLLQVRPTLDYVGRKVFQPGSCRIGQEQWKVADNEVIIICTTGLTGKPIVFEPKFWVCLPRVLRGIGRWSVPWWESSVEDVTAEGLRAR